MSHFGCSCTFFREGNETDFSTLLPIFLLYLSHNERVKESLKSLDIDLRPQWFFKKEIVKNQCILNFAKLEDVSISFQYSRHDDSLKYLNLCQEQIVHKVLGIFCSKKQHGAAIGLCNDGNVSADGDDTAVKVKNEAKNTLSTLHAGF